jgi:hypothetical protein
MVGEAKIQGDTWQNIQPTLFWLQSFSFWYFLFSSNDPWVLRKNNCTILVCKILLFPSSFWYQFTLHNKATWDSGSFYLLRIQCPNPPQQSPLTGTVLHCTQWVAWQSLGNLTVSLMWLTFGSLSTTSMHLSSSIRLTQALSHGNHRTPATSSKQGTRAYFKLLWSVFPW